MEIFKLERLQRLDSTAVLPNDVPATNQHYWIQQEPGLGLTHGLDAGQGPALWYTGMYIGALYATVLASSAWYTPVHEDYIVPFSNIIPWGVACTACMTTTPHNYRKQVCLWLCRTLIHA